MCNPVASGDALDVLLNVVRAFRDAPGEKRTFDQLGKDLQRLRHVCELLEVEFAKWTDEHQAANYDEPGGYDCTYNFLRHDCHMSAAAAANALCVGQEASVVPKSCEALSQGDIGFAHLAHMAHTARALHDPGRGRPFQEDALLSLSREHSPSRFKYDCEHARHAFDAEAFLERQVDAVERRRLQITAWEDGALTLKGVLDNVGGATLRTALEPLARRSGPNDMRTRERRLADALVELASHGLDEGVLPQRGGVRPHVQITVPLEALRGMSGASAGDMEYAHPVPAESARRLACDASIARVVLGADSAVLDVGRVRRLPAAATRRALQVRDKGCVWPGCERPVSWTSAHHVVHWADGGDTELSNLVLICQRHHWMVHEGGWQLARNEEGVIAIARIPRYLRWARPPDQPAAA